MFPITFGEQLQVLFTERYIIQVGACLMFRDGWFHSYDKIIYDSKNHSQNVSGVHMIHPILKSLCAYDLEYTVYAELLTLAFHLVFYLVLCLSIKVALHQ